MKVPSNSQDSVLQELDVITRFIGFVLGSDSPYNISIDNVDLPNGSSKKEFQARLRGYGLSEEVIDSITIRDGRGGPDICGTRRGRKLRIEAKGGSKVPNNAEHEIPKIKSKNIPETGDPVESALLIPKDSAGQFYNRLCSDHGLGTKGYMYDFGSAQQEIPKQCNVESLLYSVFIVWNDVTRHSFVAFLNEGDKLYSSISSSKYDKLDELNW